MQRRLPRESWTRIEKLTRLMSMKAIVVDLSDIGLRDLELYAEDAVYRVGDVVLTGRAAIRERMEMAPPRRAKHVYTNILTHRDGTQLHGTADFVYFEQVDQTITPRSMGRVLDTLACLPEGLRIVEHQVILA